MSPKQAALLADDLISVVIRGTKPMTHKEASDALRHAADLDPEATDRAIKRMQRDIELLEAYRKVSAEPKDTSHDPD